MVLMEHEYTVLGGINRARIGHLIGIVAAAVSTAIVTIFLALIHFAQWLGYSGVVPSLILWPLSAGTIYVALYWLFDRHVWRLRLVNQMLKVPDLSGEWHCDGQTLNPDKTPSYKWTATVTISQSWDRIRVRLKTSQSGSNSIAASLVFDSMGGCRLLYNYLNDPHVDEPELTQHRGCADLLFAPDFKSAAGEYFNGHGRFTFGTMHLTKNGA